MGLGLNGPIGWVLGQFGLGLGELGPNLSILGLDLKFRISQIHSEEISGFVAFEIRIFSSSGFHCGPQTKGVYSIVFIF